MTTQDLQAPFENSLLPSNVSRNTDGTINDASLKAHIASLSSSGVIPVRPQVGTIQGGTAANNPNSPLAAYVVKENELLNKVKKEYCFYEGRYKYALNILLDSVAQASLPASGASPTGNQSRFEVYLPITRKLNQKLNDITQIINAIATERYRLSRQDSTEINSINQALSARATDLQAQAAILKSDTSAADLRKRMVEYTKEKNNATNNLLTLYAVLNIVAIGALVILARN
jgi:hypothetical protein